LNATRKLREGEREKKKRERRRKREREKMDRMESVVIYIWQC
jgi:hypothetical protein